MKDRILTLHPQGKEGVRIETQKYEQNKTAILKNLDAQTPVTFNELRSQVIAQLTGHFEGSISWYVTTVKLDLEARKVIERMPNVSPQLLRLVSS